MIFISVLFPLPDSPISMVSCLMSSSSIFLSGPTFSMIILSFIFHNFASAKLTFLIQIIIISLIIIFFIKRFCQYFLVKKFRT